MRVAGLTGGIACGKSATAALLQRRHGIEVIDADAIAHDVVKKVAGAPRGRAAGSGAGAAPPSRRLADCSAPQQPTRQGRWGWRRVVAAFGTGILQPNGAPSDGRWDSRHVAPRPRRRRALHCAAMPPAHSAARTGAYPGTAHAQAPRSPSPGHPQGRSTARRWGSWRSQTRPRAAASTRRPTRRSPPRSRAACWWHGCGCG